MVSSDYIYYLIIACDEHDELAYVRWHIVYGIYIILRRGEEACQHWL